MKTTLNTEPQPITRLGLLALGEHKLRYREPYFLNFRMSSSSAATDSEATSSITHQIIAATLEGNHDCVKKYFMLLQSGEIISELCTNDTSLQSRQTPESTQYDMKSVKGGEEKGEYNGNHPVKKKKKGNPNRCYEKKRGRENNNNKIQRSYAYI